MPPGVGHHRHRAVAHRHHLLHAGAAGDGCGIEALDLAAEYRAVLDGGVEQSGQLQVHAVDLRAGEFVLGVQAHDRLADELPVLRVLQRHVGRRRELAGGFGHLAVAGAAPGWAVRDDAVGGAAFADRHLPFIGRRLHQQQTRGGAALADVVLRFADAAAATGGEVAPDAVARQVLAGRRLFGADLGPVAFQFLGHQLCQPGERALPHLGAHDADHHAVVGQHTHPGVDFRRRCGALGCRLAGQGNMEADHQAACGGGAAAQEAAARDVDACVHGGLLNCAPQQRLA